MTAADIAHELHGRRSGAGYVAQCPSHNDRSPSLSLRDVNGTILAHCHAGCSQQDVLAALRDRGLWPEREQEDWTPEQRQQWGRERRALERDLPAARWWRRAVLLMLEQQLTIEKAKLFDPVSGPADTILIGDLTRLESEIRNSSDESLVRQYREWREEMPRETKRMVDWARQRERIEIRAIARYMETMA